MGNISWKLGFAALSVCAIPACTNPNLLPEISGQYYGTKTVNGARTFVSTRIPAFVDEGSARLLQFSIVEALGSAPSRQVKIQIQSESSITLTAGSPVSMKLDHDCILDFPQQTRLCWPAGKLQLQFLDENRSVVSYEFSKDAPIPTYDGKPNRSYSLDELVGRAKFLNYTVAQDAERLFQAREDIQVARANLIPRLSLSAIAGIASGDYLSAIGSLLPFLFPTNWYRLDEAKELAQAQEKSFAALRGDEMNSVEGLFYLIQRDQIVVAALDSELQWMTGVQNLLAKEEKVGAIPNGTADYFNASVAPVSQDRASLSALLQTEYGELAQAVALPPIGSIAALNLIDSSEIDSAQAIHAADYEKAVTRKSFELATMDSLIEAAQTHVQATSFSFLSPGISVGFDLASQIAISKSSVEQIRKQKDELEATIANKLVKVVETYNASLQNYAFAKSGGDAVKSRIGWLIERHLQGDNTLNDEEFVNTLVELEGKRVEFLANRTSALQGYLDARAKLNRLTLNGFYGSLDGN